MIILKVGKIPLRIATRYVCQGEVVRIGALKPYGLASYSVIGGSGGSTSQIPPRREWRIDEDGHRLLHAADVFPDPSNSKGYRQELEYWRGVKQQLIDARARAATGELQSGGACKALGGEWVKVQMPHPKGGWICLIDSGGRNGQQKQFQTDELQFVRPGELTAPLQFYSSQIGQPLEDVEL